jgi:hypothetical protein
MVSEQERYQDSGERVYTTLQTHSLRLAHRNQVVPVSLSNSHTSQLTHTLPKSYALSIYLSTYLSNSRRRLGVEWCGCAGWVRSIYEWWSGVGALGVIGLRTRLRSLSLGFTIGVYSQYASA